MAEKESDPYPNPPMAQIQKCFQTSWIPSPPQSFKSHRRSSAPQHHQQQVDSAPLSIPNRSTSHQCRFCSSVKVIHYICKYICKGSDGHFKLEDVNRMDGVRQYQMGRYVSSNDAIWRMFGFPIHERNPIVFTLAVHLI